jgi:hypothetical protein
LLLAGAAADKTVQADLGHCQIQFAVRLSLHSTGIQDKVPSRRSRPRRFVTASAAPRRPPKGEMAPRAGKGAKLLTLFIFSLSSLETMLARRG